MSGEEQRHAAGATQLARGMEGGGTARIDTRNVCARLEELSSDALVTHGDREAKRSRAGAVWQVDGGACVA